MQRFSKITKATFIIMVGTLFSKVLGFFREILFAHQFGAGAISDAFVLTNSIPSILFSSVAIAISINFIPLYLRIDDPDRKDKFALNLLNISLVITIIGCVVIDCFPHVVLRVFATSLPNETMQYAIDMLRIVSFSIIFIVLERIFQSYSQANGFFLSTALLGIITNSILIITYILATREMFLILSIGVVLAQVCATILMYYSARKAGLRYYWTFDLKSADFAQMIVLTGPLVIGRIAEDASLLIDRNLAASIGMGVISSMAYASLLSNVGPSLIMSSIVTASFPDISQLATEEKLDGFMRVFSKYFWALCYILLPISVFMCFFSEDVVICIFEHGALHANASQLIKECTVCYSAGILPLAVQNYLVRGFYAFRDTKTPTYIIVFSLMINIILSIFSSEKFAHIGITSSTSISYFISCILLLWFLNRKYHIALSKISFTYFIIYMFISISLGYGVQIFFQSNVFRVTLFTRMIIKIIIFLLVYAMLFYIIHRLPRLLTLGK